MKKYNSPVAEIEMLQTSDAITLSAPDSYAKYDDVENAPDSWFNKTL